MPSNRERRGCTLRTSKRTWTKAIDSSIKIRMKEAILTRFQSTISPRKAPIVSTATRRSPMLNTMTTGKMIGSSDMSPAMKNHTPNLPTTSKMISQELNLKITGPQTKVAYLMQNQPTCREGSRIKSIHRLPKSTALRMRSIPATCVIRSQHLNR